MADHRPSTAESLLAKAKEEGRARLRVYIGAAPGVGKSYQMLEDAHALKRQGLDVVVGFVEAHGRADTLAMIGDLEQVPLRHIEYRGVTLREMDLDAILATAPQIAVIDELAHTNAPGSTHQKRYEDVLAVLDAGIDVITAVNIQHIESLNDVIASTTGVRVRETVPDWVLKRADEVVNVDVSVETLRERLRQGKIYDAAKVEQALTNFFRKGNLTALRELALRQLASDQAGKAHEYREREGLERPGHSREGHGGDGVAREREEPAARRLPHRRPAGHRLVRGLRRNAAGRTGPHQARRPCRRFSDNIRFARQLGAKVVKLKGSRVADALVEFAKREAITHVIFGQSARSRWDLLMHGSIVDRFLRDVRDATVQIVPVRGRDPPPKTMRATGNGR